eukprot:2142500-Rhodomonas_salina.1
MHAHTQHREPCTHTHTHRTLYNRLGPARFEQHDAPRDKGTLFQTQTQAREDRSASAFALALSVHGADGQRATHLAHADDAVERLP